MEITNQRIRKLDLLLTAYLITLTPCLGSTEFFDFTTEPDQTLYRDENYMLIDTLPPGWNNATERDPGSCIKLGLLSRWGDEYAPYAAVSLAIEKAQSDGYLAGYNITIVKRQSQCDAKYGTGQIIDLQDIDDVDAIIGPFCADVCKPSGYYISFWNIPFFPEGCTDPALSNKDTYNTLVRLLASDDRMGEAFVEIFRHHEWSRTAMLVENGQCELGATGISDQFARNNITVTEYIPVSTDLSNAFMDLYLDRIRGRARIIIFCLSPENRLRLIRRANHRHMTTSDYVYLFYSLLPNEDIVRPWTDNEADMHLFYSMKQVTVADMQGPHIDTFLEEVVERNRLPPWHLDNTKPTNFAPLLHDATYVYLVLASDAIAQGESPRDGKKLFALSKGRSLMGKTGVITIDENADRKPDFSIWQFRPDSDRFEPYARIKMTAPEDQRYEIVEDPYWGQGRSIPPPDVPDCGFFNELCPVDNRVRNIGLTVGLVSLALLGISIATSIYLYRQRKTEEAIQEMAWKINYEEVDFAKVRAGSMMSMASLRASAASLVMSTSSQHNEQVFTSIATYRDQVVAVRRVLLPGISLTRKDLVFLKTLKDLSHENINQFVGACVVAPNICVITSYCTRGSLQDILENDDIKLDRMFKMSLTLDLVNGMHFLHRSPIKSHGRLKSTNCLVDSRWVLKVSAHGLANFIDDNERQQQEGFGDYQKYRQLLWTAPELLRMGASAPLEGTQKGDVYSFSIVVQEITYRSLPFFLSDSEQTPKDIINLVKKTELTHRPGISNSSDKSDEPMVQLMKRCWVERPESRPSFDEIKDSLMKLNKGRKVNILDNMVQMLEKYASNLEDIVEQRTKQLVEEKKKTDSLLYRMLPRSVAESLKQGKKVEAELFDSVTIYFSDIVGFTQLSSESTPMQIVDLLNDLYTTFDDIIEKYDVYKVETIGDAYMVVSGLPKPNQGRHVAEVAGMALDLLRNVTKFEVRHRPGHCLNLRIGMHTGPCAAGVVGLTMPRYCLFGDTVNTASRMESNGLALKIHLSEYSHRALQAFPGFSSECRGEIEVKGKGRVRTYWLLDQTVGMEAL